MNQKTTDLLPSQSFSFEFATVSIGGESDTKSLTRLNFTVTFMRSIDDDFECRVHVMKTLPFFLKGSFKKAMQLALGRNGTTFELK